MFGLYRYHKFSIGFLLLLIVSGNTAYPQNWQWARGATCGAAQGGSEGWLVKTDAANNVFVSGYYYGYNICFGNYTFYNFYNSANTTQTIVVKYDSAGNVLWASASTSGESRPMDIATDGSGNLYVFGIFTTDTIRFGVTTIANPGFDTANPLSNTAYYLLKYNAAGNIQWAKSSTTNFSPLTSTLHGGAIAIDSTGNVYISSTYNTPSYTIGSDTVYNFGSASGTNDIFLSKYTPGGNLVWLKSFGGLKDDYVAGIAGAGNKLYLAGYFNSGFIRFGSSTIYTQAERAFIACLDTSGHPVWAKSANTKSRTNAVAVDNAGNIYLGGGFSDTISFGSYFFHNSNGGYYLLKFDTLGNTLNGVAMHFNQPVASCCDAYGLTTDKCGNAWLSANIYKGAGLILDNATTLYAPTGSVDPMFIAGYDGPGNLISYAALPSGAGNNTGLSNTGLSADTSGNIYLSGDYRVLNPFVIGSDSLYVHNGDIATIFVAKYHPLATCDTAITPILHYPDIPVITITPNPAASECVLNYNGSLGTGPANVAIRDITGKLIATYPITSQKTILPVAYLPDGIYLCMVKVGAHPIYTLKMVVVR